MHKQTSSHAISVTTVIAKTAKGHRVWLQGTERYGWNGGDRYDIKYNKASIVLTKATDGRRGVTAAKGGIIDLCNRRVTAWAEGATQAHVRYTMDAITIRRAAPLRVGASS